MGVVHILLANPWFSIFLTGAGFFSDSYDLFITDGVTNMLKDLGPATKVAYTYNTSNTSTVTMPLYFSGLCVDKMGTSCLRQVFNYTSNAWVRNPKSVWTAEFTPRYQLQTSALKNGVSNAALIGSITGQLVFGFAGDMLGRKWCFVITTLLIILGCLGSSTASVGVRVTNNPQSPTGGWSSDGAQPSGINDNVYLQLMVWRSLLGFGVGGEYPLAGTISSEGAKNTQSRGRSVLYTFSMQGWGKLTASLVNYGLVRNLAFFGGVWTLDGAWRFALAIGCLLNVLTAPFRFAMEESHIFTERSKASVSLGAADGKGENRFVEEGEGGEELAAIPSSFSTPTPTSTSTPLNTSTVSRVAAGSRTTLSILWEYRWTLFGTASTWFLIDVTFYGQSLMNTTVVAEAVTSTTGQNGMEKLRSSLLSTVWIMLIAIPGYFIAIATVDACGRKPLQRAGFLACAATFLVLGLAYNTDLRKGGGGAGFVFFYGLTYLFSNAGPNSVTFLMPAEAFPTLARASAHGISAAMGKVGATVGAAGMLALFSSLGSGDRGVVAVMLTCAGVATLGALVNEIFCRETGGVSLTDVDKGGIVAKRSLTEKGDSQLEAGGGQSTAFKNSCPTLFSSKGGGGVDREGDGESSDKLIVGGASGGKSGYGTTTSSQTIGENLHIRGVWPE